LDGGVVTASVVLLCASSLPQLNPTNAPTTTQNTHASPTNPPNQTANEENATLVGIGVDEMVKRGLLDRCKRGPLFWVDTADSQPCIGTGGIAAWQLTAHGERVLGRGVAGGGVGWVCVHRRTP
jgi:hypothetical protein